MTSRSQGRIPKKRGTGGSGGGKKRKRQGLKPWAGPVTITRADGSTKTHEADNQGAYGGEGGALNRARGDGSRPSKWTRRRV